MDHRILLASLPVLALSPGICAEEGNLIPISFEVTGLDDDNEDSIRRALSDLDGVVDVRVAEDEVALAFDPSGPRRAELSLYESAVHRVARERGESELALRRSKVRFRGQIVVEISGVTNAEELAVLVEAIDQDGDLSAAPPLRGVGSVLVTVEEEDDWGGLDDVLDAIDRVTPRDVVRKLDGTEEEVPRWKLRDVLFLGVAGEGNPR